ncbi:MAG: diguanylate cyclase, partial [Chitinivibrionales bacterium]|nr:diguanylate cyclase [Chitinivibrionales bacterium]
MPFSTYLVGTAGVITLLWVLIGSLANWNVACNTRTFPGIMIIIIAAIHLTRNPSLVYPDNSPLLFLYYGLILLYASFGKILFWMLAVIVPLVFETGMLILHTGDSLDVTMMKLLPEISIMSLIGVFPFFIAKFGRREKASGKRISPDIIAYAKNTAEQLPVQKEEIKPGSDQESSSPTTLSSFSQAGKEEVEGLLSTVVYFMRRNFDAYSALGFIFDPERQVFVLNSFFSKSVSIKKDISIPVGKGIIGQIGVDKRSFNSGDLSLYGEKILYYSGQEMVNSICGTPILSSDKELLGALIIDNKNKRAFTDQHRDTLRRFSSLAAALITNARMRICQEKNARQFQIFYESSQKFTTAMAFNQVFDVLLETIKHLVDSSRIMAIVFNGQKRAGVVTKVFDPTGMVKERFEFPLSTGIYSFAFQKRKIVNIGDFQQYRGKYFRFLPDEPPDASIRSILILPILDDEARCLGLLSVESSIPNQFTQESERVFSTLIGNASVAITRALLYQRMERLATTDGLTGLNNHRFFQEQLSNEMERSRRYRRTVALLLMDIDHFKSFNDTYGHPVGDLVLKEIAQCIRKSIRHNDFPARYGGEEFAVILPENTNEGAMITAERIRTTIENHIIKSADRELRVTVSIG